VSFHTPGTAQERRTKSLCSGIHHLKEIAEAGFEAPAVNQIQVGSSIIFPGYRLSTNSELFRPGQLHPFCQQREIVDYCQKNDIIVQAYSPLIQARRGMFDHPIITVIADKHGKDNAQVLIRWSLQKGYSLPLVLGCVTLFLDCSDFAGGCPSQKAPTQSESSPMRLFMTLGWTRRIWPIWTPLIEVTMDPLHGTLSTLPEELSERGGSGHS